MEQITKEEYLKALDTIRIYTSQLEYSLMLKTGGEREFLDKPLKEFDFSIRCHNLLNYAGIITVADLLNFGFKRLFTLRNFGKKSLGEIQEFVAKHELKFADQ